MKIFSYFYSILLITSSLNIAMEQEDHPNLNKDRPTLNIVSLPPYNKNSSIQTWGKRPINPYIGNQHYPYSQSPTPLYDHYPELRHAKPMPEPRRDNQTGEVRIDLEKKRQEEKLVNKTDGRRQVKNSAIFPYSAHGLVLMTFGEESYLGTATMISPHIALTAGHNLIDDGKFPTKIEFTPGVNGEKSDVFLFFGKPKVVAYYVAEDYLNKRDSHEDYGLLILDKPLVDKTGSFGLDVPDEEELLKMTVHITGYPGDKITKQDHHPMYYTMGDKLSKCSKHLLYYKIDTSGGQSGGAFGKNIKRRIKILQPQIIL